MKVLYIGSGYVGTCSAAVSADSGHDVLVYDTDKYKIGKFSTYSQDEIDSVLFERGLSELIAKNKARIFFTDDLGDVRKFLDDTDAIFMCLPTPEKDGNGETDLTYYDQAAENLAKMLKERNSGAQEKYVLIINKSTVPIKMVGATQEIMERFGVVNFGVGSNPEFLVEGKAIEGSIRPERIVVGAESEKDLAIFRSIYKRFYNSPTVQYIEVNPYEAAAGKLLANYILFNRLANCFDVVGRTCEKFQKLDFEKVRKILISDNRIGEWGFYDSMFAGGSCFIKDSRSLAYQLSSRNADTDLINDTLLANERQLNNFLSRAAGELHYDFGGKCVALLGLAFKRDTNDIRNSAALKTTDFLLKQGVSRIKAYDPLAGRNFSAYYANHGQSVKISLEDAPEQALMGADAAIITCDWPEFRELSGKITANLPKGALIMDGRRMLASLYDELSASGYNIIAVGSPLKKAATPDN